MKNNYGFILLAFLLLSLFSGGTSSASDLDDGISKHLDDSVAKDDELGQRDRNVSFIRGNAKSQADVRARSGSEQGLSGQTGTGNMNSVVLGPGGSVRGDIIIIDESRGPKTQVVR